MDGTSTTVTTTQHRYWIGTVKSGSWDPQLPEGASYCRGQLELGEGGFEHYQIVIYYQCKKSRRHLRRSIAPDGHFEPTRSHAALNYVWKLDTRIGEPFEFGSLVTNRNSSRDWDEIRSNAEQGLFANIPSDIFVRYYVNLHRIRADTIQPTFRTCETQVFWGSTGTGKSHRAWNEAGPSAYSKDSRSKFWCGYTDQDRVIIDEFRGAIDIAHLLRWLDKYPVRVETKGSSRTLVATKFWITSNLPPEQWYPDLDKDTLNALLRRVTVTRFTNFFQ